MNVMETLLLAQAATPQSMWTVIWDGLEWPAFLILLGSVTAIALIVEHFITVRRVTIAPPAEISRARALIEARNFRECMETLRGSQTFFARVLTAGLSHARHGFDAMHSAALEKSAELSGRLFRKVEYMNILGNLGPLMGLLGTVLGMIYAFGSLASGGGEADAAGLARGISLALVNTLFGLGLAVVGIGFFGACRNRTDALTVQATVEVLDLLEYFRPATSAPNVLGGPTRPPIRAQAPAPGPVSAPAPAPRAPGAAPVRADG